MANMNGLNSSLNQLNDLRSYSRHWLGEFIDLYQSEECLWQPKHPDYSNHNVRNKAYDKLVEKLKEVEPNPDRAMVVRKINSLRSAFRREYRKSHTKANYETRLWYYDKLLFIAEQNTKRLSGGGTIDVKPRKRSLPLSFDDDDTMEYEDETPPHLDSSGPGGTPNSVNTQNETQQQAASEAVVGKLTVASANCVTFVKSEEHLQQEQQNEQTQIHHHLQQQQQHQHAADAAAAAAAAQTQPQHTTAVKVLEITSLDSNSQREIQQAVNSLEHQHQMQQQLQHQNGQAAAAQLAQIHQQVPTIQIAREHLQPLFGSSTFSTTSSAPHRNEDEFDAIGMNVASKLRVMNSTQRIIAEKLISDVLFNAQLDNLTVNSTLTQ